MKKIFFFLIIILLIAHLLNPPIPPLVKGGEGGLLNPSLLYADDKKPVQIKKTDKCPVCGMFVYKYPDWIAQIIFKDNTYAVFDGAKDMFKYYHNLNRYNPAKKKSDIIAIYVTEYYSTRLVPAEKVFFIIGSDVYGPMGKELIPVETERGAKEFMKDHNGKKILTFREITEIIMEELK